MDPATSGMVNDYRKTLPSDLSAGQLDFGSTPVAAPRWNQLVGQEGGDVGKFNSMVNEVGGPNPQVTQTPLVLRSDKGEFGTASLFQVKGPDGKTTLVDGQGAKYTDMNDYLENNDLDDSWTMLRPANPGAPAGEQGQLISGPAHNSTFGQQLDKFGTHVAGPAMVAGGALLVGASAVGEVGTVGLATPAAVPAAALGAGMIYSGSAMIVAGTGQDLFNRYQHGRSISPADPQARAEYLNLAGLAGGAGGLLARTAGRTGLAAVGEGTALGISGAQAADQGRQLYNDWGNLTPQQRTERAAQLGANAALLALPAAAGRASSENGAGSELGTSGGLATRARAGSKESDSSATRAIVDAGKYDYLFGRVNSNPHNANRSTQNAGQLARVGVFDNAAGRSALEQHFNEVASSKNNVMRSFSTKFGNFEIRDSLFAGPRGFIHFETTWQVADDGLRLITAIPHGGS
jgi:filamentous hemagglutinin